MRKLCRVLEIELWVPAGGSSCSPGAQITIVRADQLDHHRRQFAGCSPQRGGIDHRGTAGGRHPHLDRPAPARRRAPVPLHCALATVDFGELVDVQRRPAAVEDRVHVGAAHAQHPRLEPEPEVPGAIIDNLENGVDGIPWRSPSKARRPFR